MKELTEKQKQVLTLIQDHISSKRYPPTIRELAKKLECSQNNVRCVLSALQRKQKIEIIPKIARGIRVKNV